MKKLLLAIALFAFIGAGALTAVAVSDNQAGTSKIAIEKFDDGGSDKDKKGKKGKKECCKEGKAEGKSCCKEKGEAKKECCKEGKTEGKACCKDKAKTEEAK